VVDHSIAHPLELCEQLKKAYGSSKVIVDPSFGLWKYVLHDCLEADIVLVNSEYVRSTFINYGFQESKLSVVNLGVREDFLGLKTSYAIDKEFVILYTGALSKRKGIDLICSAAEMLITTGINFRIIMVGKGEDLSLSDLLLKSGVITLEGHVSQDNLKDYFTKSDIYVFPSYCEGSAQSLKEAMGAGLPVIATNESGAPIIHGENGLLIKSHSSQDLYNAILLLYSNQELRKKLGSSAVLEIRRNHNWEKYSNDLMKVYEKGLS